MYNGRVIRVDADKVQILYDDPADCGPHVHYWLGKGDDPPLVWQPAPPVEALDHTDYDTWNDEIHPDLWNQPPIPRKKERIRESYPVENDVRIEGFMDMGALDLFHQFLPVTFWRKVVIASNEYASKVLYLSL